MVMRWKDMPAGVRARMREKRAGGRRVAPCRRQGDIGSNRSAGGAAAERVGTRLEEGILAGARGGPVELEGLPKSGARFVGGGRAHALPIACDDVGCVVGSGRAVFFDAKHVGRKVAGLRCGDEKIVKRHQAEFLKRMAAAGAIAGVLVECERRGEFLWLDGRYLEGKTVHWEDPRWVVLGKSSGHGGGAVDFAKLVAAYTGA